MRPPRVLTAAVKRGRRRSLHTNATPARKRLAANRTWRWCFSTAGIPPPGVMRDLRSHTPTPPRVATTHSTPLLPPSKHPPGNRPPAAVRTVAAFCPVTAAATVYTGIATCTDTSPLPADPADIQDEAAAARAARIEKLLDDMSPQDRVEIYFKLVENGDFLRTNQETCPHVTREKINEYFREADTDNDGDLTKEEFHDWFKDKFVTRFPEDSDLESAEEKKTPVPPPTKAQLNAYSLRVALPFFGFGFIDNFLMIVFGESIDMAISQKLGMTMMFSAGLGNVFADSIGIMTGDVVDRLFVRMERQRLKSRKKRDDKPMPLTSDQLKLKAVTRRRTIFKIVGIASGCVVGMCPLLFV